MANNHKSAIDPNDHPLGDSFQIERDLASYITPGSTLLLALSGGVDSVVLLHLLCRLRLQLHFELHAMHVHHGLSPHAERWAAHCQWLCQQMQVPLTIARVAVNKEGKGIEAAARQARYEALSQYVYQSKQPDWIVTAHHQGDQAETLFLQLLRGAGVKGLAAMPIASGNRLLRPLLNVSKQSIMAYANAHHLRWCDDESNLNEDFDRNFMRHQVIPLLKSRYASLDDTLGRTAVQMAETQTLLAELAQQDANGLIERTRLNIAALSSLSELRFQNVLRFWFDQLGLNMPSRKRLQEIAHQLRHAKVDAAVKLVLQSYVLLRYDGHAYLYPTAWLTEPIDYNLIWSGESQLHLPNGATLRFKRVKGEGIGLKCLNKPLSIRNRVGGERIKLQHNRPTKSLKQWFQDARIPPWEREHIPLIYHADQLISVPVLGTADGFLAKHNEEGVKIVFECPFFTTNGPKGL